MAKKAAPSAPSKKIEKKEPAKKAPKPAPAKQKEVKKVDAKKTDAKKSEVKKAEAKKTAPKVEKKSPEKAVSKSKEPLKLLSAAGKISTPEKIDKKLSGKATDLVVTVVEAAPSGDEGDVAAEKSAAVPAKKAKLSKSAEAKEKAARQASSDEEARWSDLFEKYKSEKPFVYDMKKQFDANKPLQHKVLGWGWILSNENDRLEVLFKEGRKILISNYVTK